MQEQKFRRVKVTTEKGTLEVSGGKCTIHQEADLLVITKRSWWSGDKTVYVPVISCSSIEGYE